MTWDDLDFWKSKEWEIIQERLDVYSRQGVVVNPSRPNLFHSLTLCPFERTKVIIVGQDPYPNPEQATGLAFSLPVDYDLKKAPETWKNIKRELCYDLHIPSPMTGSFEAWAKQGVLLWNAVPICEAWKTLSLNWDEWAVLTKEILISSGELEPKPVVILLGSVARRYLEYVNDKSKVIATSHPSPRGAYQSNPYLGVVPFIGSRIFSRTNDYLCDLGHSKINWRL